LVSGDGCFLSGVSYLGAAQQFYAVDLFILQAASVFVEGTEGYSAVLAAKCAARAVKIKTTPG
jgi:hypothetical protein